MKNPKLSHITDERIVELEGNMLNDEIAAFNRGDTTEEQKLYRLRQIIVAEIIARGLAEQAIANR